MHATETCLDSDPVVVRTGSYPTWPAPVANEAPIHLPIHSTAVFKRVFTAPHGFQQMFCRLPKICRYADENCSSLSVATLSSFALAARRVC